jgi:hypothetical protein
VLRRRRLTDDRAHSGDGRVLGNLEIPQQDGVRHHTVNRSISEHVKLWTYRTLRKLDTELIKS